MSKLTVDNTIVIIKYKFQQKMKPNKFFRFPPLIVEFTSVLF